jgi:hypothetical protein
LASSQTITLSWGANKKEHKEQSTLLSDESLQVGDLVVVDNQGDQRPHKAHVVDIFMENKWASIRWGKTQNIDYADVGDSKQFSMEDSTPRKQKTAVFFHLFRKKMQQLSNIKMTDLMCNIAQKIIFIW